MANVKVRNCDHITTFNDNSDKLIYLDNEGDDGYLQLDEVVPTSRGSITNGMLDGNFAYEVTHNKGSSDVIVTVRNSSGFYVHGTEVLIQATSVNKIKFWFNKTIDETYYYSISAVRY